MVKYIVVVIVVVIAVVSGSIFHTDFSLSKVVSDLQLYLEEFPSIGGIHEILPWQWSSTGNRELHWEKAEKVFAQEMKLLEKAFPNQKSETWIQLKATIGSTLKFREPAHPAVITALMPPDMDLEFGNCFMKRVALAVNKAVGVALNKNNYDNIATHMPTVISPNTFKDISITHIRKELDAYLNSKGKSIIVENIDKFTNPDELMMFHGICDNYHAVDPRATVVFPVRVPEHTFAKYKHWTSSMSGDISYEVLTTAWIGVLDQDTIPALVARVADAVILLTTGDTCQNETETQSNASETTTDVHHAIVELEKRFNSTINEFQVKIKTLEERLAAVESQVKISKLAGTQKTTTSNHSNTGSPKIKASSLKQVISKSSSFSKNKTSTTLNRTTSTVKASVGAKTVPTISKSSTTQHKASPKQVSTSSKVKAQSTNPKSAAKEPRTTYTTQHKYNPKKQEEKGSKNKFSDKRVTGETKLVQKQKVSRAGTSQKVLQSASAITKIV